MRGVRCIKMKLSPKSLLVAAAVLLLTGGLFQNCSDPLNLDDQSSFAESLPFAFDTTLDTIAYMSCAGGTSSANRQAIWTIRGGAFATGNGIRLTDAYLGLTSSFSPSQRGAALSESPRNRGAILQLAIRQALNYQAVLTSSGGGGQLGEDYSALLGPLDEPAIAERLANVDLGNPQRINYFSGISGLSGRTIEGGIRFTASETEAESVRGQLSNTGLLTATYTDPEGQDDSARGPAGLAKDKVYGRGYKMMFQAFSAAEPDARILAGIDEINLETSRPTGIEIKPWVCSADMRFRIYRQCGTGCPCHSDGAANATLAIARRLLKVEYWYIDVPNRCVVQKEVAQQCYPTGSGTPATNYHFVSVCTRQ
jgi:hypothetical protein